ncbi:PIR Superfamily Protein [Plasmodium ovale wallikeri]|uniref:PIR Superfamily Protein n=1 Tax=Plasmodium ovale wallikeri TaxID=864142 RepID=A0A1A9ARY2_PLAOA|nr:PIR Superfamily Protein [Plasmodium ovale wallikeri]
MEKEPEFTYYDMTSLPSVRNYNKLDNRYDLSGLHDKCYELEIKFEHSEDIHKFCMKLTGILNKYPNLLIDSLFDDDNCKVVNYWMFDHLYKNIFKKVGDNKKTEFFAKVMETWYNSFSGDNKCNLEPFFLNGDATFNELKTLYDYALNYPTIKHYLTKNGLKCIQDIKNYIDQSLNVYNNLNDHCKSNSKEEERCKLFQRINQKHNYDELSNLKCTEVVHNSISLGVTLSDGVTVGHLQEESDRKSLMLSKGDSGEKSPVNTPDQGTSSTIIAVLFPLFGILLISFILYKFTLVGPWIMRHIRKKEVIQPYFDELEEPELLSNTYESLNINSDNSEHHISYNSVINY